MDCAISTDPLRLRASITAVPGEYDATPTLNEVCVSAMPLVVSPDRAAVAAVLCFANFIAGSFAMARGCSPQVSNAIRRWFAPADMHVLNVDFEPTAHKDGDAAVHVVAEGINTRGDEARLTGGNDVVFRIVNEGTGSVATRHEIGLASNAWLLADPSGSTVERILPGVGIAVMFAEDLFANAISIPGADLEVEAALWTKLQSLLDSTGLGLVTP
jgi:hypothetical protein